MVKYRNLYIMMIPVLGFFIIFRYAPMWWISIAFRDYRLLRGLEGSPWVGLKHFVNFFTGPHIWMLIRNTLMINIFSLLFGFPCPIILALLLNELRNDKFKRLVQSVTYLPHFVSVVVMVGLVINFLSPTTGLINIIIKRFGGTPIFFMAIPRYFRTVYITSGIWQQVGWGSIIYLAALAGVDPQLYEASFIDGAKRFQQLWNITLPSIASTIIILFILRIGQLLNIGFERIFLMANNATREVSEVLATYVYKRGILNADFSFATAVGLFRSIISVLLVSTANVMSKKVSDVGIW